MSDDATAQPDASEAATWHLRLFKKSLTKQAKLRAIQAQLGPSEGLTCLDIGGDNGIIPYMLRRNGGTWLSVDASPKAVTSMRQILGNDQVHQIEGIQLPFDDESFDVIVIIDYLEHVEDDAGFVRECHRCLKQAGRLIAHVPNIKKLSLIRSLRNAVGLTDDLHGHVRPGYTLKDLYTVSKDGFDIVEHDTYGGFFVQLIDTFLQLMAGKKVGHGDGADRKGLMVDANDLQKFKKSFRAYSVVYPFLKIAEGLDWLFRFTCNHFLVISAKARPWIPRREVKIRDGRSIADASINTTIGSAREPGM